MIRLFSVILLGGLGVTILVSIGIVGTGVLMLTGTIPVTRPLPEFLVDGVIVGVLGIVVGLLGLLITDNI